MKHSLSLVILMSFLSGCTAMTNSIDAILNKAGKPASIQIAPEQMRMNSVPKLDGPKITIAVYNFLDKTGQAILCTFGWLFLKEPCDLDAWFNFI